MKRVTTTAALILSTFLVFGCSDDATGPSQEDRDEGLVFELTFADQEIQTLSEVTFTVKVTDHHGDMMIDFDDLQMEHRMTRHSNWETTALTANGSVYMGSHTFTSSGLYELRIMGRRDHGDDHHGRDDHHHGDDMEEFHRHHEPIHVHRAHVEAGGYRVEHESVPGHIHAGEPATLRFWVMEPVKDTSGAYPPIVGLNPQIRCTESNGMMHDMPTTEAADGMYETSHTVEMPGDTRVALLFTGEDSNPAVAEFLIHVEDH